MSDGVSVQALDKAGAKANRKTSAPAGPARIVPTYMTSRPEDAGVIQQNRPRFGAGFSGWIGRGVVSNTDYLP